ncbi:MAG TPA: serine hydrolase, partial [Chloroflexota bacterium]|nr:serine hydrolase [Chloroflexota bacterium]
MRVYSLERRIQACVDAGQVVGLALAIVRGHEVTYARGFGTTSVEPEGVPVTPTTLFDSGSISKVILGTLILRLVERGILDLDEPVVTYLPGFAFSNQALGRRVTLRHLLSHTSGLPAAGRDWAYPDRQALKRFVWEELSTYGFIAEPGRVHQYANAAICLAGHVAEAVCGRPYRELVQEHVFDPLGMSRTTYDHAVAMTYRLALPHEADEAGRVHTLHRWTDNPSGEPSGFAIAPVLDLAQLAMVHLNGGRIRGAVFLSPESVGTMHTPQVGRHVTAASHAVAHLCEGYGLGLMVGSYRGARVVSHGGVSQSFNAFLHLLPESGAAFVLLTNHGEDAALSELVFSLHDELRGFADRVTIARAVLLPPAPGAPDREQWPRYEGTYLNVAGGRLATVRRQGERLVLELGGSAPEAGSWELVPISRAVYCYEDETGGWRVPVEFLLESGTDETVEPVDAETGAAFLFVGGNPYRRCTAPPAAEAVPGSLERFTGTYRDPHNAGEGAVWEVALAGGRLRLSGDWADDVCVPCGPTTFLSPIGLLEFDGPGRRLTVGKATRYH